MLVSKIQKAKFINYLPASKDNLSSALLLLPDSFSQCFVPSQAERKILTESLQIQKTEAAIK